MLRWVGEGGGEGRRGERGADGGGSTTGVGFQYEPADASHADHRWYLCSISMESEFMPYVFATAPEKKKKQRSL